MAKTLITTRIPGELEIDHQRGVIYFHAGDPNWVLENQVLTALRICHLPVPIPRVKGRMLDISHMKGTDWGDNPLWDKED